MPVTAPRMYLRGHDEDSERTRGRVNSKMGRWDLLYIFLLWGSFLTGKKLGLFKGLVKRSLEESFKPQKRISEEEFAS